MNRESLIYVASPYYHDNLEIMKQRYDAVSDACYLMAMSGWSIISPVMIWHPVKVSKAAFEGVIDSDLVRMNKALLLHCDALIVLQIKGWEQSKGIAMEVDWARDAGKEVRDFGYNAFFDTFANEGDTAWETRQQVKQDICF